MTTNYLLQITQAKPSAEVLAAIFNIARTAHMQFGYGYTSLWVLPDCNRRRQEIIAKLQTLPGIQSLFLLNLSRPAKLEEAAEVRQIFNGFEMDTTGISDIQLCSYIDSIVEGRQAFYFDFVHSPAQGKRTKMFIKPIEQHPEFSPDWLEHSLSEEDMPDREYTADDFETETLEFYLDESESMDQNPGETKIDD